MKEYKRIKLIYALVYPAVFLAVAVAFTVLHVSFGNTLLDVAANMLITGVVTVFITFRINGRKRRR